jgi:hypothetical protein
MQIHEITIKNKVNEGFMDAVKGIGSVAAQGINQSLGTNLGGVAAGAIVGPGQRQQAALQINKGLAAKQAQQLSNQYIQSVNSAMKQDGVQSPAQMATVTQAAIRKEIDQIIFKQLLGQAYVQDLNQLNAKVEKSVKPQMASIVNKINSARRGVYDLTTAQNPQDSLYKWTELATAAAEAINLITFASQGKGAVATKSTGDVVIDQNGKILYRGQPYNNNDPIQQAAVSQFLLAQKNLVSTKP